jgi:NAD(P)H-hydrate epimerase
MRAGHTRGREVTPSELAACTPDVIVDALVGYGLSSAPRGTTAALIDWARTQSCTIVSLDVPSGIDPTIGAAPGLAIQPTTTVTLALPKTGLSRAVAGHLFLADLGIPDAAYRRAGISLTRPFGARFVVSITRI